MNEVRLTTVASDQVCATVTALALIDHMLSLRLDESIHPDTITEDDFKDLDFFLLTME